MFHIQIQYKNLQTHVNYIKQLNEKIKHKRKTRMRAVDSWFDILLNVLQKDYTSVSTQP